ncbi:MAG: hypothetical protein U0168_30450 [Nannocystaceae bacterium]
MHRALAARDHAVEHTVDQGLLQRRRRWWKVAMGSRLLPRPSSYAPSTGNVSASTRGLREGCRATDSTKDIARASAASSARPPARYHGCRSSRTRSIAPGAASSRTLQRSSAHDEITSVVPPSRTRTTAWAVVVTALGRWRSAAPGNASTVACGNAATAAVTRASARPRARRARAPVRRVIAGQHHHGRAGAGQRTLQRRGGARGRGALRTGAADDCDRDLAGVGLRRAGHEGPAVDPARRDRDHEPAEPRADHRGGATSARAGSWTSSRPSCCAASKMRSSR